MTPLLFLSVAGAGGLAAALRWLLSRRPREQPGLDPRILAINVIGSLAAGYCATALWMPDELRLVLITGACGGFTTWGTVLLAEATTARGVEPGRRSSLAPNLVVCIVAALAGLLLGAALPPFAATPA